MNASYNSGKVKTISIFTLKSFVVNRTGISDNGELKRLVWQNWWISFEPFDL